METTLKSANLIELFEESLQIIPSADKVCVEVIRSDRHDVLTFAQLCERARGFALWLVQEGGIGIGDKVAIVSKNRADWDVALWGILQAGAVPVLIDPERGPHGVLGHLHCTDAQAVVLADDYHDQGARDELADHAAAENLRLIVMTESGLPQATTQNNRPLNDIAQQIQSDDTAIILCTSGTTGDPREVELTHANLIANILGSVEKVDLKDDDVVGHILPPHHSFGLTVGKLLPLAAGATNIYTNRYREVSDLIRDRRITIFVAIPALYTTLAKKLEETLNKQKQQNRAVALLDRYAPARLGKMIRKRQGWTHVRFFLSGAAPMPRWVLDVLWKRGFRMYEGYGTTENSPVYGFNERLDKLGSVGQPISTLTVKIVDEDNETLGPHQRGEICLGGPCIMKGYYKNQTATEAVIDTDENGVRWLHTGDLGYLDEDNHLYITGRKKYLIILPGGKNVNPERVETALSEAPFVKEVLVVPTRRVDPNGIMEEMMRALVQPAWGSLAEHTGRTEDDLATQPQLVKNLVWESIRTCQQNNKQLSAFEKIGAHHIEIHPDEFVKTSTGKVKREHYMNLEHLEAKHIPIVGRNPAPTRREEQQDTAGTPPTGN
jgi:long-chain acyl-CoA synthetase